MTDQQLPSTFEADFEALSVKLAKGFYDLLVSNITSNKYRFSNSSSTVKRKGFNAPMVETGELLAAIKCEGGKVFYEDGLHHSGVSFVEMGDMIEYGRIDKGFLGFPFWRKTFEEYKPVVEKEVNEFLKKQVEA